MQWVRGFISGVIVVSASKNEWEKTQIWILLILFYFYTFLRYFENVLFRYSNCWDVKHKAKGDKMSFKKITKKEWLAMGLPETITYIGPFYENDRKKKEIKKPILTFTRKILPKKK